MFLTRFGPEYKLPAVRPSPVPVAAVALASLFLPARNLAAEPAIAAALPARIARIVLHTLGGPDYGRPARRFRFLSPAHTRALWSPGYGAHWIVWTDGGLWPRHPRRGQARHWTPDTNQPATEQERHRLAVEAAPVYSHVTGYNDDSVGIEVAHAGRSDAPFPEPQLRAVAWLVRTLLDMSAGRLQPEDVVGHKDLDHRPAYVGDRCDGEPCPYYVDPQGQAYRRRVDPPESLFVSLRRLGLDIPRSETPDADVDLIRAERIPAGSRPAVRR